MDKADRRTEFIGFYVGPEEKDRLQNAANAVGMSLSGYLRFITLYKPAKKEEDDD